MLNFLRISRLVLFIGAFTIATNGFAERFFLAPSKSSETKKAVKLLKKKEFYPEIIYLQNEPQLQGLQKVLKNGDVLEFHAHGLPWVAGDETNSDRGNFSPFAFADAIALAFEKNKDLAVTIDLRFCLSGVAAKGPLGEILYARDLSEALLHLGINNVTVHGYTGYVNSKSPFHESLAALAVNAHRVRGAKLPHCPLDEGLISFKGGKPISAPNKTLVDFIEYDRNDVKEDDFLSQYFEDRETLLQVSN